MANNSSSSTQKDVFIFRITPSVAFLTMSFLVSTLAIVLNSLEIRLIIKGFKTATDFELVLLNLAIADLLSGLDFAGISALTTHAYLNKLENFEKHFVWFFAFIVLSVSTSTTFVIVIGLERFFAIKVPLKHRMFHTDRRRLLYCLLGTWTLNVLLTVLTFVIDYYTSSAGGTYLGSDNMIYILAGLLTFGCLLTLVLYTWLGHLILLRSVKLLDFDKKDASINPRVMRRAMKKEKATILACTLVLVSFLVCNLPLVVGLYQKKLDQTSGILIKMNAVCNPLVYFFKSYLERRYARKNTIPSKEISHEKSPKAGSENSTNSTQEKNNGYESSKKTDEGAKDRYQDLQGGIKQNREHESKANGHGPQVQGQSPKVIEEMIQENDETIDRNMEDEVGIHQIVLGEKGFLNHGMNDTKSSKDINPQISTPLE
ncbi:uncharacterized protein LOC135690251 [Rhopilema esculentum]|uniref:uncharacterized protein LOC135690251 n=1 Tax=Rhopilema esculentum TaxID=499914 RepID=UPI0031E4394C